MESSIIIIISVFCTFVLGVSYGRYGKAKQLGKEINRLKRELSYCEGVEQTLAAYGASSDPFRFIVDDVQKKIKGVEEDDVCIRVNGIDINIGLQSLLKIKQNLREDLAMDIKRAEAVYPNAVASYIRGQSRAESELCKIFQNQEVFAYLRFGTLPKKDETND